MVSPSWLLFDDADREDVAVEGEMEANASADAAKRVTDTSLSNAMVDVVSMEEGRSLKPTLMASCCACWTADVVHDVQGK